MTIRAVVTRGYGTFGTIPEVVTRGYIDLVSASASITADAFTESDIIAGGKTIVIELTNDTWIADITAVRQAIIDGLDSAQSELLGWNNEVRDKEVVGAVVRTSDTVVTITLSAATYDITTDEVITVTIPASALTGAVELTGSPTIDVIADAVVVDVEERPSGGWAALNAFDSFRQRKRRRKRELEELLEEVEELEGIDGEIAKLLHANDAEELLEASIRELEKLVVDNFSESELVLAKAHNERLAVAFARAATQRNFSALQAFEREMERARDEEDFFLLAVMTLQ